MTTDQRGLEMAVSHIESARKSVKLAIAELESIQEESLSIQAAQHYYVLGVLYLNLKKKLSGGNKRAEDS